jgi:hypothetical protein
MRQDIEQAFAETVGRRPDRTAGRCLEGATAEAATDDAQP